mmetsp:Transcript_34917/g.69690  ORF Transcript_34917/g.69690 Transcript_34917/m.69690 type:complete len:210 (+) Transcript_34917:874-1503(+)
MASSGPLLTATLPAADPIYPLPLAAASTSISSSSGVRTSSNPSASSGATPPTSPPVLPDAASIIIGGCGVLGSITSSVLLGSAALPGAEAGSALGAATCPPGACSAATLSRAGACRSDGAPSAAADAVEPASTGACRVGARWAGLGWAPNVPTPSSTGPSTAIADGGEAVGLAVGLAVSSGAGRPPSDSGHVSAKSAASGLRMRSRRAA